MACADQLRQVEDLKKVVTTEPLKGLSYYFCAVNTVTVSILSLQDF